MIATLLVVIILGVLVVIVLASQHSSPPPASDNSAGSTTTTVPKTVASGATEADLASCEANYATVQTALSTYRALVGHDPPAGTSWATSDANGGPLLQSWPTDGKYYAMTWNGAILSVVPLKGASSHGSYGTSAPRTGCFAL